jgi:hypothetical protein
LFQDERSIGKGTAMTVSTRSDSPIPGVRELLGTWPWIIAAIPTICVAGMIGWSYGSFKGIDGFSASNYGWLVFTVTGGSILA